MRFLLVVLLLTSCQSFNICRDNPRNMSCMSGQELEKELNEII